MRKTLQLLTDETVSLLASNKSLHGVRKLAQRFILELFTEEGSMLYYPHRGCNFVNNCKKAKSEWDVQLAFAAATAKIKRNFKSIDKDLPVYDRLKEAKIDKVYIEEDAIRLLISITNKVGTSVQVDTPYIYLDEGYAR